MSTEAENAGEAAVRAPPREYGGILSPPAVAGLRLWQTQRRRDHLGGAIEALADSHEALRAEREVAHAAASRFAAEGCAAQANCLAAEAEREARDAAWRALVGELAEWCDILLTLTDATAPIVEQTYGQADPEGWVAQRETVACIRARLRQRLAALADTPPAPRGAAE